MSNHTTKLPPIQFNSKHRYSVMVHVNSKGARRRGEHLYMDKVTQQIKVRDTQSFQYFRDPEGGACRMFYPKSLIKKIFGSKYQPNLSKDFINRFEKQLGRA
jgi:hypothetical protein